MTGFHSPQEAHPQGEGEGSIFASENTQPGSAKTVADILTAAADLIEPEGRWIKGAWARDAGGNPLENGADPKAVCWCAFGAVRAAAGRVDLSPPIETLRSIISRDERWVSIHNWNDASERTQAEVVAALRAAAEKAATSANSVGTPEGVNNEQGSPQ